ncbi:hypothetical protein PISMIDRAFT_105428, partial [Pisolithus microcarpus 441]
QSLLASPPSAYLPGGRYDFAVISQVDESDWSSNSLRGHAIAQLCLIFCLYCSNTFLAYIQCFNATFPSSSSYTTDAAAGMHVLKCTIQSDGARVGKVIPLHHICLPAHVIPHFGKEANPCLTHHNCYELSNDFWLNKYWNKEFFYALSLSQSVFA